MFKIAKLEKLKDEKVSINLVTKEIYKYENNIATVDTFKTLAFDILGENFSFCFDLDCRLEKLLEISMNKTIDFDEYTLHYYLTVEGLNSVEPEVDIKITRYLKNKFIIFLTFYTDNYVYSNDPNENDYSGMIEITFDLDDYLNRND